MEGQGEILRIEDRPTHGTRDLTIDANTKQITDENFQSLPEPYRVARYGYSRNKVVLTFDDGPDPEWTPKILDVLKREHAPATFFLIGIQTDRFSGLAKRIYNEGHTIGNHTFTHPDVSNISSDVYEGGIESHRAAICQPGGSSCHAVAPALCNRRRA